MLWSSTSFIAQRSVTQSKGPDSLTRHAAARGCRSVGTVAGGLGVPAMRRRHDVGPLGEQGLDEALGLAVGAERVCPRPLVPHRERLDGRPRRRRDIPTTDVTEDAANRMRRSANQATAAHESIALVGSSSSRTGVARNVAQASARGCHGPPLQSMPPSSVFPEQSVTLQFPQHPSRDSNNAAGQHEIARSMGGVIVVKTVAESDRDRRFEVALRDATV